MIKNWLKRLKEDERGLTLVELLAVVVVLGIIGGIAFVSIGNVIDNTKKDAHVANAQQVVSAAKLAEATGTEIPSTGLNIYGSPADDDAKTEAVTGLETLETLVDPWNNAKYGTAIVKKSNEGIYSVTLTTGATGSTTEGSDADCELTEVPEKKLLEGRDACGLTS